LWDDIFQPTSNYAATCSDRLPFFLINLKKDQMIRQFSEDN
jgi:hypothetical protein